MAESYYAKEHYRGEEAEQYEAKRQSRPKWEREQTIVRRFLEGLPKDVHLLDCPVGTGRFFEFYEAFGFEVTGVDVSSGMVEQAERAAEGRKGEFHLQVADAAALPFENKAFGALVSHRFIKWLPSDAVIVKVLKEFARVVDGPMLIQMKLYPESGWLAKLAQHFGSARKREDKGRKFTERECLEFFAQAGLSAERFDDFKSGKSRLVYYVCRPA